MWRKPAILWATLVTALVAGLGEGYFENRYGEHDVLLVPRTLINMFLAPEWFRFDSLERSYSGSSALRVAVWLVTPFALPYYFFRSRSTRAALASTGLFLLFLAAVVCTYAAA